LDEQIAFMAPNGQDIELLQESQGGWAVVWYDQTEPDAFDYEASGPDSEWETVQFRTEKPTVLEAVWTDDAGERWLSRHLIPASAVTLDDEALRLARRDFAAAEALDRASRLAQDVALCGQRLGTDADAKGTPFADLRNAARRTLDLCEQQAVQLRVAFLASHRAERAAGRGVATTNEGEN
jgi:hypothetical protein